jgi:hypothetical protein
MRKLFVVAALAACHGKNGNTTPQTTLGNLDQKVDPTLCDTTGKQVVTFDLNKDNKPDVWRLYQTVDDGGTKVEFLTCKQVDFDHDGRKDWVVAYNRKGNPLYEKADFDFDGKWDYYAVYDPKTGLVAEVQRDTNFDGKFDVKETYDSSGQLVEVQRDRNGDGKPDVWEHYKDGVLVEILYDDNFTGTVTRREEIPGAHPKVEMPTTMDTTATDRIDSGSGSGSGAATPTPPKKKK